ncbi:ATP-binding SpoIIE family protein phosphatase [Streptomyces nodosus]
MVYRSGWFATEPAELVLDGTGRVLACTRPALDLLGGTDAAVHGVDFPSLMADPAMWRRLTGDEASSRSYSRVTLHRPCGDPVDVDARVSVLMEGTEARFVVRLLPVAGAVLEYEWGMRMALAEGAPTAADSRVQRRVDLLHAAAVRIGGSLDVVRNAREAVDLLVPIFADYGAVDLTEDVLAGREPREFRDDIPLRRVAVSAATGPWPEGVHTVGNQVALGAQQIEHLRRGAAGVITDLGPLCEAARREPERYRPVKPPDATSVLVFPLQARGTVLGAIVLWRSGDREPFDLTDGSMAEAIGSRLALGLDNALRYTRERCTVEDLQRSLLPPPVSCLSASETAGAYAPASTADGTGGSWYDSIRLSGVRVAFVVGRVPGHGVTAAGAMGRLRSAVQTLADMDPPPEELLSHLDDLVTRIADDEQRRNVSGLSTLHGATCLYSTYDPITGQCLLASAGHPVPLLFRRGQDTEDVVGLRPGPPLGNGTKPFQPLKLRLRPGDVLAFHSSPSSGPGQDTERDHHYLCDSARNAARGTCPLTEAAEGLKDRLCRKPRAKDIALLLARVRRVAPDDTVFWELPAEPSQVAHARSLAAAQLTRWGLDEPVFATEIIVSELVTNAIRYAGGPIGLRLIRHRVLVCEVSDPSQSQPYLRRAQLSDEGGRGLFLVAQLTRRWGSRYHPGGKTIWTEQPLTAE